MKLPIMEHFYTIQGEGVFTGQAAYFIRIAGCDVGCVWCDVKASWETTGYPTYSAPEIVQFVQENSQSKLVVITGGEPAMYDLTELCDLLKSLDYLIHIETSGAYDLKGQFDWVTLSPKKFKAPVEQALNLANELKVVVYNKSDFEWAQNYAVQVPAKCKLLLQPEWSKREQVQPQIVDFVKDHPEWQISLQTHKYLGVD